MHIFVCLLWDYNIVAKGYKILCCLTSDFSEVTQHLQSNIDFKVCLHKLKMGHARPNEALPALLLSVGAFYRLLI